MFRATLSDDYWGEEDYTCLICYTIITSRSGASEHAEEKHNTKKLSIQDRAKVTVVVPGDDCRLIENLEDRVARSMEMDEMDWIRSPTAVQHMERVMNGNYESLRHSLFMDKRQRQMYNGANLSQLHKMSNPTFFGGGGQLDIAVIMQLEKVFVEHLPKAQMELKDVFAADRKTRNIPLAYASLVLLPETFIHKYMLQGRSRKEAEVAFGHVAVGPDDGKVDR